MEKQRLIYFTEGITMEWSKLFGMDMTPTLEDMEKYVSSGLWGKMNEFLTDTYNIKPKLSYSKCSAQPGWNVKYQKGGKSLCTLYPMEGFFIALVVIGNAETAEAELLLPTFGEYMQDLYKRTAFSCGGRWLMVNVTEPEILDDVKTLVKIRVRPKK
jgi:hypothetical protein